MCRITSNIDTRMSEHLPAVGVAIIGAGRMGSLHARTFASLRGWLRSERDLLCKVAMEVGPSDGRPVGDFMTPCPETVVADDTLAFALHKMDSGGYRHLPVLDDDERVVGVISVRDMLTHLTRLCSG